MHTVIIPTEEDRKSANHLMWAALYVTEPIEDIPYYNRPPENWALTIKDGDQVVSTMSFATTFSNLIRGVELPFAGVWGVATAPTHRGRGMVRALFTEAHKKMKEEGLVLSILDPRSVQLYEKLGYANAEQRVLNTFSPKLFRPIQSTDDLTVRRLTEPEEYNKVIQVQKSMARFGSRICLVENVIGGEHLYLFERDSEPIGTVNFYVEKEEKDEILIVRSVAYTSDDVLPAIVQLIASFGIQCREIRWYGDLQTPVHHFLTERKEMQTVYKGSMMMRVIDFVGFCEKIRVPDEAIETIVVQIHDQDCAWNNGIYYLHPSEGRLVVERVEATETITPEVVLSEYQLSQVIGGLTPATMLQQFGQLACSIDVARRLEAIFPRDNFMSYMRF